MAPRAPVASTPPPPPYTPAPAPAPVVRPAAVASAPSVAASVAPPPSAAPAALASASATQVASAGALSRVLFAPGSADLSDDGRQALTQLATRLGREADSRIQLLAYADGNAENESQARRLSLSRALAVRAYLIDQGIRSTRVNVQALGIKSPGGPPDRVDAMAAAP
jgi:outer membrane protein OmpA-like peptidoglycan-associated protein